jgi:hypothetical protein
MNGGASGKSVYRFVHNLIMNAISFVEKLYVVHTSGAWALMDNFT